LACQDYGLAGRKKPGIRTVFLSDPQDEIVPPRRAVAARKQTWTVILKEHFVKRELA